jgi:hypothetical protein
MKKVAFWIITVVISLLLFEVLASLVLLYGYRTSDTGLDDFEQEVSSLSSVNALHRMGRQIGLFSDPAISQVRFNRISDPDPFFVPDTILGYRAEPGEYKHIYLRQDDPSKKWKSFATKVTINADEIICPWRIQPDPGIP